MPLYRWVSSWNALDRVDFFNGPKPGLFFVYFSPFLNATTNIEDNLTLNGKRVYGVLRTLIRDRRMEGADESTELWQPPLDRGNLLHKNSKIVSCLIESNSLFRDPPYSDTCSYEV